MQSFDITTLSKSVGGKLYSTHPNKTFIYICTDSRNVVNTSQTVFFALKGPRFDAHKYIPSLVKLGVRCFVVSDPQLPSQFPNEHWVVVNDTHKALQDFASFHRSTFNIPVIGITGSNGKTIVKEWLYPLLSGKYNVIKSPKSYNSQVGVPLSVIQMESQHTLAIFEAGISKPNEMQRLASIIRPTIGIFTNIGSAHSEGFESQDQKIREKLMLFSDSEYLIYCLDHSDIHRMIESSSIHVKRITWGRHPNAWLRVLEQQVLNTVTWLNVRISDSIYRYSLPCVDDASVENILHCITLMHHLGYNNEEISKEIRKIRPISMRLELKQGVYQSQLIDDSYNNDIAGLSIALDFMDRQGDHVSKTVILSDVMESGLSSRDMCVRIDSMLHAHGVSSLIAVGEVLSAHKDVFSIPIVAYPSTEVFIKEFEPKQLTQHLVLVKGARSFAFERIVDFLQLKSHRTVFEINLNALAHNLNYFRNKLQPGVKTMAMVKAFAYGSGNVEIAQWLTHHKVDYLAVAYADEGVSLREHGVHIPIMVMNPDPSSYEQIRKYKLEPELYSKESMMDFLTYFGEEASSVPVHVKLDTGMHRLGFEKQDIDWLCDSIEKNHLSVKSLFTHLAATDDESLDDFTNDQLTLFEEMSVKVSASCATKPLLHAANSAGASRFARAQYDMVRIGIGLYGVGSNKEDQQHLATVGTLKTIVSQVKSLDPSETVGYNRRGKLNRTSKIATIAIGYADGYDRRFGNGVGFVSIHGKHAPVIGNVCMDMTMIDVTDIPEVHAGDVVEIYGDQVPIYAMAEKVNTIAYELLTQIGERVKRVFYWD